MLTSSSINQTTSTPVPVPATSATVPEHFVRDNRVLAIGQDAISQGTCKDDICSCLKISTGIACGILYCWLKVKGYGV